MGVVEQIRREYELLRPVLDERMTRLWAAARAEALGEAGPTAVFEATGIRYKRIREGRRELQALAETPPQKPPREQPIRRPGAGRKRLVDKDPALRAALEGLIEPDERGDPESPLRWTTKSLRNLSDELRGMGHSIGPVTVGSVLRELGYSLQGNRKRIEGKQHVERDAQFRYIARKTKQIQSRNAPVISVDTKKKELVGQFANRGVEWRPEGEPIDVRVHDFIGSGVGKAVPYGVYDIARNEGFVNVGVSGDTGAFAVNSIRTWWRLMGRNAYPDAKELLVVADAGGSNGPKNKLWKTELQRFADDTGLVLHISHLPPGTSKWNKVEHRLFSFISMNWRGRPLEDYETIVNLISNTTNSKGLRVKARVDRKTYPRGVKVARHVISALALTRRGRLGEWNYELRPRT